MTDDETSRALWTHLRRAGDVAPPEGLVLEAARRRYLDRVSDSASQTVQPTKSVQRRRVLVVIAAVAATVACFGTLSPALMGRDASTSATSSSSTTEQVPGPDDVTMPNKPSSRGAHMILNQGGPATESLVGYFGAKTFYDFTRTEYVSDVLAGRVVATTAFYLKSGDDGDVITKTTLQVDRDRSGLYTGERRTIFQFGGVLPKRVMADQLESKFGPLSKAELRGVVEVLNNGQAPASVGDTVIFAVGNATVTPAPMVVAALWQEGDHYAWRTEPPNPDWPNSLDHTESNALFSE